MKYQEDIAVIGMAGKFPEAQNTDEFYRNLKMGRDSVRPLSLSRIRDTSISPGKKYRKIGFMEDIDKFDFQFFHILRNEAEYMAPQHRIMLQVVYETVESAGYSPDALAGSRTAVYLAANSDGYLKFAMEPDSTSLTGNLSACIAGRIARYFNFTGNAVMVDTACSSSLVALHLACQDIRAGEAEMAICGGIHIIVNPPLELGSQDVFGISSMKGKSLTFSAQADGIGIGEGAGCVLLKPLRDAERDKDNILGVIKASAVNQDAARSSTLTAPSSVAQSEVIAMAIGKSGIDPGTLTYVEAHGTGTRLGDPIEVEGLSAAFRCYTEKRQFCALSALKSNIGHCDVAAGILGFIKVLLSLSHKELFPSLHVGQVNPYIDFLDSPFYLNLETRPWVAYPEKRRAAVSSFGISGTNCHVVLEEWTHLPEPADADRPFLFLISGHTREALLRNARALQDFANRNRDLSLERISYTLNTGRTQFPFRKSFVAASHDELVKELASIVIPDSPVEQEPDMWYLFTGSDPAGRSFLRELADAFPAFGKGYEQCLSVLCDLDADTFIDYAFGYSSLVFLKALGLQIRRVTGLGNGKAIAKIAAGKASLEELAEQAVPSRPQSESAPGWDTFVRTKLGGRRSLIWEIGLGSINHRLLNTYSDDQHVFESANPLVSFSVRELLKFVGRLSDSGLNLNWRALYAKVPLKAALPLYQFEQQRCWLRNAGNDPMRGRIYQQAWKVLPKAVAETEPADTLFVIYGDHEGIGNGLDIKLSQAGNKTCRVFPGASFSVLPGDNISFDWNDEACYDLLLAALTERGAARAVHIHLGGGVMDIRLPLERQFAAGLYPSLLLAKKLSRQPGHHTLKIITDCAAGISGKEAFINAAGAALHGLAAGIRAELNKLSAVCIDIDTKEDLAATVDLLSREVLLKCHAPLIGLREGRRYEREWVQAVPREEIGLEESGVYLVIGGGGGIGLQILESISYSKATFVVVGRRRLPHKDLWPYVTQTSHPEDYGAICGFIRAEENGARMAYYAADVSDTARMSEVFASIRAKFGPVQGIIHAAGIGGKARIQRHTVDSFRETLLPKAHGVQNLYDLSDRRILRFFIVFSSYSAVLSADRESSYSAANAFLDAFSARLNREGIKSMTIRWLFWTETGMGARMKSYDQITVPAELAITNKQGIDIFDYLLRQGYADVIVAKKDPSLLLTESRISVRLAQPSGGGPSPNQDKTGRKNVSLEDLLREIWQKVLSRDQVLPDDNFFRLGGHSLLGLQMRNQIEKRTGIRLEYRDIAENPTMKSLTARLMALHEEEKGVKAEIKRMPEQEKYPLSEGQKGIWLISQQEQKAYLYNIYFGFKMFEEIDIDILRKAVNCLLLRHEILRTRFHWDGHDVFQWIVSPEETDIPVEYREEETDQAVSFLQDRARHYIFDLEKAPLFRIWLVREKGRGDTFFVTLHHIILDGWSVHIFISQLFYYYDQLSKNGELEVSSYRYQYKDYVLWENQQLSGPAAASHRLFWRQYLKGLPPPLDIPADGERRPARRGNGNHYRFRLSRKHAEAIGHLGAREGGSPFLVCLAVFQILLHRYSGQHDFFVGTPSTQRYRPEFEDQLGYFVNMLPLRCRVSRSDTFDTILERSCQSFKAVQDHQIYPFYRMVNDAGLRQTPGRHYLFDIIFSYEYQLHGRGIGGDKAAWCHLQDFAPSSKYDIEFILKETGDGILGIITYDTDLYSEGTIAQMADHFVQLTDTITLNLTVDRFHFENRSADSLSMTLENMSFDFE
jgi:3-oxoacyl-(acyl-carrier-protein) synthase/NAD(P)-dependent dehydrogenase (short-subunit alcohol dehydrogenase family)